MHDINIKDNDNESIKFWLKYYTLPIPYHLNDNNMTIFDKACFGEIPDISGHKLYE